MEQIKLFTIKLPLILIGLMIGTNLNGQNLEAFRWKNRILVINIPDAESSKYQDQIKELSRSIEELKERKLVLFEIKNNTFKFTDFKKLDNNDSWKGMSELDKGILKKSDTFKIILIGLDGGIKLEKTEIVRSEDLFDLIDSMPMRRQEIRKRGN